MIEKYKIIKTKNSVIIESKNKRYEVYFDESFYQIFIGQPQEGSFIKISRPEEGSVKLEYFKEW